MRQPNARFAATLLTLAQTAGQTGSWAALTASMPLALSRPNAAAWMAALIAAWSVPAAVAQLATRSLTDAAGPRRTSVTAWIAGALTALPLATGALAGATPTLTMLAVLSVCRGIAVVAGDVAPTWLPRRPDLSRAGAWLMLAAAVPVLSGPLGAASLIAEWGVRTAWTVVAFLCLSAALASAAVPGVRPPSAPVAEADAGGGGLSPRIVSVLAATLIIWLTYGALSILQPVYVQEELHASLAMYGWTMTAFALGGVAVSLTVLRLPSLVARGHSVPAGLLLAAHGELLLVVSRTATAAMSGAALWGAAAALVTLASRSAIVTSVPLSGHGRVLSTWRALQALGNALPALCVAPLVSATGLPAALLTVYGTALAAFLVYAVCAPLTRAARIVVGAVRSRDASERSIRALSDVTALGGGQVDGETLGTAQ